MTMFPAHQSLSKQHFYGGYVGLMSRLGSGYDYCPSEGKYCIGSDDLDLVIGPTMADQDESRTDHSANEAAASSSKDVQDQDKDNMGEGGWLQLSIGGRPRDHQVDDRQQSSGSSRGGELVELNLLPPAGNNTDDDDDDDDNNNNNNNSSSEEPAGRLLMLAPRSYAPEIFQTATARPSSLFLQPPQGATSSSFPHHHQEINWIYNHRPITLARPMAIASSSSSPSISSFMQPPPPAAAYFSRPFQLLQPGLNVAAAAGTGMDFRVIDPPRRPHSGIWFMLQASQNQAKEPFLPQIPKSYLRIKDGRMTIRLVMKYLVNKLRLENESEVEITCRGQELQPWLTLQHVRDNLWNLRNPAAATVTSLINISGSSSPSTAATSTDHVMVLHYGRRRTTTALVSTTT